MAVRKALTLDSAGQTEQLPDGDTLQDPTVIPAAETGTTYTTVSADFAGGVIKRMTNASDITITIAPSMTNSQPCIFRQEGAGQLIFVEGSGVTNKIAGSFDRTVDQYSAAMVTPDHSASNLYWIDGRLA